MENKYIYNDAMDTLALSQIADLEATEGTSFDAPKYSRQELDSRTLEIVIDCLEAGLEAYEDDEDAVTRINNVLRSLNA